MPVLSGLGLEVQRGQCVVIGGPSGAGKSSILKMIFGAYRCDEGSILVADGDDVVDVAKAGPRRMLALRRDTIGYVSQFLRALPRVAAVDVVAEPLLSRTIPLEEAHRRADVIDLIHEKKRDGAAILAIVHDDEVRDAIADAIVDVTAFSAAG